jgi:hypothetical protein
MLRIVAVAAALIASLIAIKDHRVLERMHVTGSCSTVLLNKDGSAWQTCEGGWLTGKPDLATDGCTDKGARGKVEFWHCPASLAANATH